MTTQADVDARPTQTMPLPPAATAKLQRLLVQIAQLQAAYRDMAEMLLIGLGVDMETNDVSLSQDASGYTVTPRQQVHE